MGTASTLRSSFYSSTSTETLSRFLPEKIDLTPQPKSKVIPILLYHYVEYVEHENDVDRISLNIEPHIFEQQVIALKEAGYTFITPSQLPEALFDESDTNYIILSFDDGYRTFYPYVMPILERHEVPVVNYVLSGLLNQPNYLYGWQVQEMVDSPYVEVALHGYTHRDVTAIEIEEVVKELELGSQILKDSFGLDVVSYAYPYGRFNDEVIDLLPTYGIENAVTIEEGVVVDPNDLYRIPRLRPQRFTGQGLINHINSSIERLTHTEE